MKKTIDYYFSPSAPWAYLGHRHLLEIADRHGACILYKPVDYRRIFPISGGLPVGQRAPQREHYRLIELDRWRKFRNITLKLHPKYFPVSAEFASLLIIAAIDAGKDPGPLTFALMRACWTEQKDISNIDTLARIVRCQGLDWSAMVRYVLTPVARERFDGLTVEAIERQVFGAPFYFYKKEPFWGQDRLEFLDRALAR